MNPKHPFYKKFKKINRTKYLLRKWAPLLNNFGKTGDISKALLIPSQEKQLIDDE